MHSLYAMGVSQQKDPRVCGSHLQCDIHFMLQVDLIVSAIFCEGVA